MMLIPLLLQSHHILIMLVDFRSSWPGLFPRTYAKVFLFFSLAQSTSLAVVLFMWLGCRESFCTVYYRSYSILQLHCVCINETKLEYMYNTDDVLTE